MDDRSLYPVGYIQPHFEPEDPYGVVRYRQMTVDGWRPWSNRIELKPNEMPAHTHTISPGLEDHHNHRFDHGLLRAQLGLPPRTIGKITKVRRDELGLDVSFNLNDYFTAEIKKGMVSLEDLRFAFGVQSDADLDPKLNPHATDMDLFPDITAPRGGLKYPSPIKENNMPIRTLKSPAENIERKDLTVALRLYGQTRIQDELYDVIALVQTVSDNEAIYRVSELKVEDVVGKNVRVHGIDAAGVCSDFSKDDYSGKYNLVIAGKLEQVSDAFVIVSEIPDEPLGEDTLRVVQD